MYGLQIHRHYFQNVNYSRHVPLIQECEQMAFKLCSLVDEWHKIASSEGNDQSFTQLSLFKENVDALFQLLKSLSAEWHSFQVNGNNSSNKKHTGIIDDTDLIGYDLKARGLLLTVMHILNKSIDFVKEQIVSSTSTTRIIWNKISGYANKKLLQLNRLVGTTKGLVDLLAIMIRERNRRRESDYCVLSRGYDFPFSDSLNLDDYHEELSALNTADFLSEIGSQFVPGIQHTFSLLVGLTASHSKAIKASDFGLFKMISLGGYNLYYLLSRESAAAACVNFFNEVTTDTGKALWGMQEHPLFRPFVYMNLPAVHSSKEIQLPMKIPIIKKHAIVDQCADQNSTHHGSDDIGSELLPEGIISLQQFNEHTLRIPTILEDDYCHNTVSVRLILPSKEHTDAATISMNQSNDYPFLSSVINMGSGIKSSVCCFPSCNDEGVLIDPSGVVLMHIHGGGFIAMSPFGHENYVRLWSRRANIPIVSVNYRKAPECKYPSQVEECYRVYKWILKRATEDILGGVPLRRVILVGDSAGGNLSLGVTLRAIHDGLRLPDVVAISYPAAYMSDAPSPARLLSLIDPLVNKSFLTMCANAVKCDNRYGSHKDQGYFPYLSPCVAPNEIFRHFPPLHINVGALDPLYDDSIYTARRIAECNGGKVKLEIYDGMGHGYMNMVDTSPEAKMAAFRLIDWVSEQLNAQQSHLYQ